MTGVGFSTLLAGLLTFVASFSKRVLAYQHVTDTPFPNVIADKKASQSLVFPAQFASLFVANSQTRTPSGRRNLDARYLFGIIACVHDDALEMQKLNNEIGMQDKGVIQVFRIRSRCNHLRRIQGVSARWNVSVGCVSDC
jgi:hypothetical protein